MLLPTWRQWVRRPAHSRKPLATWQLCLEALEDRLTPAPMTFTVLNTNNEGPGSLRQAIIDANTNPDPDLIQFDIGNGPQTINLTAPLPAVVAAGGPVVIDATTQPGFAGQPLIELNGAGAGAAANGLVIESGSSTVKGFVINRFTGHGLVLRGAGQNVVQTNYIGINQAGTTASPNGQSGIHIDNVAANSIGGLAVGTGNVISGNTIHGIYISGAQAADNLVAGNLIGLNAAGAAAVGNGSDGIRIEGAHENFIGSIAPGGRNVLSGNGSDGIDIRLEATANQILNNYIGTDITGLLDRGNTEDGIYLAAGRNTVGGITAAHSNLISGNNNNGIFLDSSLSTGNLIQGNYIGTDLNGTADLGNAFEGIFLANGASANTVGGTAAGAGNLISGNDFSGIHLLGSDVSRMLIEGNRIGTRVNGDAGLGNELHGIFVDGSSFNTIGGTAAGAGNLISGNKKDGVRVEQPSASANLLQGNQVGTNAAGSAGIPNLEQGVHLFSPNNTIGGTVGGAGNLISGNGTPITLANGIQIEENSSGNLIQGNLIGVDKAGTSPVPNLGIGIGVLGPNNTIGGTTAAARNIITGNSAGISATNNATGTLIQGNYIGVDINGGGTIGTGIDAVQLSSDNNTVGGTAAGAGNVLSGGMTGLAISRGNSNLIQGNLIGTDATGTVDIGSLTGIQLFGENNTIGGTTPAARNLISGNVIGIGLVGNANFIQGNYIGTNFTGTAPLKNDQAGIIITGSANLIGGFAPGAGNVISGNGQQGILLEKEEGAEQAPGFNLIQGNFIGTNAAGTAALANTLHGIEVNAGVNNTIGGTALGARNIVSGNMQRGILITNGATQNLVAGNFVGLNNAGTGIIANGVDGIVLDSAPGNTIGGTVIGSRNVISGNNMIGVKLQGATTQGNLIQGNYIGTNAAGTAGLGNPGQGILLDTVTGNSIGGAAAAAGNVISANGTSGVELFNSSNNLIQGNLIGTNAAGTAALANGNSGIDIDGGTDNTIGGTTAGARNVISGNTLNGIGIDGGAKNLIQGNYIGTTQDGSAALANGRAGILMLLGSTGADNTVGGTVAAAGNVLSGNTEDGLVIQGDKAERNLVQGNRIGTQANGTGALPNGRNGILIDLAAKNNTIGGTVAGAGNIIANNAANGVSINVGQQDGILGNSIFNNGQLGIRLGAGANGNIGAPTLTGSLRLPMGTQVSGTFVATNTMPYILEFFSNATAEPSGFGEGQTFLFRTTITPTSSGTQTFTATIPTVVAAGFFITATVTDANNNTSQFSNDSTVLPGSSLVITKSGTPPTVQAGGNVAWTFTITNNGPDPATSVTLTDALATGTSFVSLTTPQGFTSTTPPVGGTGTVTATTPSLAAGASATFTLVVQVNPQTLTSGELTNTVQVTSQSLNTNPTSSASAVVNVQAQPNVAFIAALYNTVLDRNPLPTEVTFFQNSFQAGATRQQVAAVVWESAEHRGIQVQGYYQQYLGRAADSAGLTFWTNQLVNGVSETQVQVSFLTSSEYTNSHPDIVSYLFGLYEDVLDRAPDAAGFAAWQQAALSGTSRAAIAQAFLTSPEYLSDLVENYYQTFLGRAADVNGLNFWLGQLVSGMMTEDQVAEAILGSQEFFDKANEDDATTT